MHVRFLSDGSEYRSYSGGSFSRKDKSGGLFWWTILITLMIGFATFCWFFSIMVFQHPEKPFNYRLLSKLDKLPILRNFSVYTAPEGLAKSAREVLASYYAYTPEQIAIANDILKRSYIRNYEKTDPPVYVRGDFQVLDVRPLGEQDVIESGWVLRTRSVDLEDVDLEILLPGLALSEPPYQPGEIVQLDKRSTFTALVHVERLGEERFCGTVIPIVYGGFKTQNNQNLGLNPPKGLNMDALWPITQDPGVNPKMASMQSAP